MQQLWKYIAIAIVLCPAWLLGQDPYYRVIDASDGLPNNDVYGIFQDSKGFIWITTDDGLCRFDGHGFKSFTSTTQSAKAGSNIFEDKYGRIWYENFDGRLYFVSSDTLIGLAQSNVGGFVRSMAMGDYLYYPYYKKLDIYDLATLRKIRTWELQENEFIGVNARGSKYYWMRTVMGGWGIDAGSIAFELPKLNPAAAKSLGFILDDDGDIFSINGFDPGRGLERLGSDGFEPFAKFHGAGALQTHALYDHKIWIAYNRGMEVIDLKTGQQVSGHNYFADKSITAIMVDREGNHWFGTQNQGLLFVPDFYSQRIHNPSGGLSQLIQTPQGLLVGTQNGELLRFEPQTQGFVSLYQNDNLHAIDYLTLVDGRVLEGSPLGTFLDLEPMKTSARVQVALKDAALVSDRYLAVTTPGSAGLMQLPWADTVAYEPWDSIAQTSRNPAERLLYEPLLGRGRAVAHRPGQDAAYFATANGLMRLTPRGYSEVTMQGRRMYGAKMDADSTQIYLLTTLGELYVLDAHDAFTPIDDLPVPPPYSQLKLLDGKVYLLARKQLLQLQPTTRGLVVENMIAGLETSTINDLALHGDKLALATDEGLILLDPNRKETDHDPMLRITGLYISGQAWPIDSMAVVDYGDHEIVIDYAILHFSTLGEYPLYYRINEGGWSKTNPETRQLLLAQLAPGDYRISFCLGKANAEVAATVQLRIRSPFWMQWWFYGLLLVLAAALVWVLVWQRNRRIERRHLQHLEKLELENNLRQSTLTAIRSQMNPHFFFNALNTIQAFIFSDDKRNATNYLSKFSKLTRMVLEMSEKEAVSLQEEMQAITLYLELEKSRFGDDFQFQIEVGPGIAAHDVQLPSMIIQPFVENAVKHGLLHQSGVKELRVAFAVQGQLLVIEVDDNGIGRRRSEELQRIRQERHQPFSVAANKKRIDILNEGHTHIGVAFIDKYDADGLATGTTVKITLPLQLHSQS